MAKLDNVLAILWMLNSDKKVTAKQISDSLEINIRTVYRYVDTLSKSGVPIISDSGHHGGYSLLNNNIETPLFFNIEEKKSLIHAALFAEKIGYYDGDTLKYAISKLKSYSNEQQLQEIEANVQVLNIIDTVSMDISEDKLKKKLEYAIAHNQSIRIKYTKANGENSERAVNPYKIIYWKDNWYLVGYCHLREKARIFRVSRIMKLELLDVEFEPVAQHLANDYFINQLMPPLEENRRNTRLVLRGTTYAIDNVCRHWYLENYVETQQFNEVEFLLDEEIMHKYIPQVILPYSKSIQVIEPLSMKKALIENLTELIEFHQK